MKISTRGRYGLRAMIDLAENQNSGPIPLREISERQNISEQYLEQLFSGLRRSGLVKSIRGAHGGYMLNHPPDEIIVGDILRVLEGPIAPAECVMDSQGPCENQGDCVAHGLWEKIRDSVNDLLDSMTLNDLKKESMANHNNKEN